MVIFGRDIVPLGRTKNNFNYNLDEKRVLNFENVVNDDDNIKQDISIDVYGRAEKEEGADAESEAPAAKEEVICCPLHPSVSCKCLLLSSGMVFPLAEEDNSACSHIGQLLWPSPWHRPS